MNIFYLWPRSWVCSVWPSVGLGSVRSGPFTESFRSGRVLVLGLFGLAHCWPWVCLVWPRSWVFSVWPRVHLGSVSSGPVLALDLFGLTQGDQGLFCLAHTRIRVCSVWTPLSATQVRLAHTCPGDFILGQVVNFIIEHFNCIKRPDGHNFYNWASL